MAKVAQPLRRPLLNAAGAAAYLGLVERQVRRMVVDGEIPHIRLSERRLRFDPAELDGWLDSKRRYPREGA